MAKSMDIPQDIIDNVIAVACDDMGLLKECSLVSSSFLVPSRKHLFSRITIRNDETCEGIRQLIVENPFILPCVKAITLNTCGISAWVKSRSLPVLLRLSFHCLESFSLVLPRFDCQWDYMDWSNSGSWDWNCLGYELKDALWNIMLSSTLKTLSLDGIVNLPISFFYHIGPLTLLDLCALSPIEFHNEYSSLMTRAPSMGVIDRCVWRFGEVHVRFNGPTLCTPLPFVYRLRNFEIYMDLDSGTEHDFHVLSFFLLTLCVSLTCPAPAVLEHLRFSIVIRDFEPSTFCDDIRKVWSPLDYIANLSTTSRLQRVDVNITYMYHFAVGEIEIYGNEIVEAVSEALPLLRMRGVLFVHATRGDLSDYSDTPSPTHGYEYDEAYHQNYDDNDDDDDDDDHEEYDDGVVPPW